MPAPAATFTVRHVQLLRALFAAAAALMITFSSDHSAAVGLAVFSGFAMTTALILMLGAWLALPAGTRGSYVLLAAISIAAGLASAVPPWRSTTLFFVVVIAWALLSGLVELLAGIRARRAGAPNAQDAITVGAISLLLGVALLVIPQDYAVDYAIEGAGAFTLTGIILAVGVFGAYAAIVAVFLGIAGFTPRRATTAAVEAEAATPVAPAESGGAA